VHLAERQFAIKPEGGKKFTAGPLITRNGPILLLAMCIHRHFNVKCQHVFPSRFALNFTAQDVGKRQFLSSTIECGFAFDETTRRYSLDLKGESFHLTPLNDPAMQMELLPSELTPPRLVGWLDRKLRSPSINQTMLAPWLLAAVESLLRRPGMTMEVLDRGKFILLRKLAAELEDARVEEAKKGYRDLLFGAVTRVVSDDAFAFDYAGKEYPVRDYYQGSYRFGKHYFPKVGELKAPVRSSTAPWSWTVCRR
jgi:hypothetical protein